MKHVRGRLVGWAGAVALVGGLMVGTGAAVSPAGAAPSCSGTTSGACFFSYTGSVDSFTVPAGVDQVTIEADGAQGGAGNNFAGGAGAVLTGTFGVTPAETLSILVGGAGGTNNGVGGGGGGSFVYRSATSSGLLIAAGGGGGGSRGDWGIPGSASFATNGEATSGTGGTAGTAGTGGGAGSGNSCPGAGGAGLVSNGADSPCSATGGKALVNGAGGGVGSGGGDGGFGGGGGGGFAADGDGGGGGGGYSGGGGGNGQLPNPAAGGGGGSFNLGATTSDGQSGGHGGNGQVIIWYQVSTPTATSPQFGVPNQTDVFSVASNGEVDVRWVVSGGTWNGPLPISSPGLAPAGAHLAVSNQFGIPNQTDVFVVDKNGTTEVLWVDGAGAWNGPLATSRPGLAPPGVALAASNQFGIPNQTNVFTVANNGAVQVLWVDGAGAWNGPLAISPTGLVPPRAGLATSNQFGIPNQTDVYVAANNSAVQVLWVDGAGAWNGPLAISPAGLVPAGAGVAASNQFGIPNQTDVFVVLRSGTVEVVWVDGAGNWNAPATISPSRFAEAGAALTASQQFGVPNQTDLFVVDGSGTARVVWVDGAGSWNGPLAISQSGFAPIGVPLAASNQLGIPSRTDVFAVDKNGAGQVVWVDGAGKWNGPMPI